MNGILNINKPEGLTSYRIVAMVKRLSKAKHVGHAGTLDPAATGVLPVCIGNATHVVQFLMDSTKVYQARILLGVETDTYDSTGTVLRQRDVSGIGREQAKAALANFCGEIEQLPPMYSAVKMHGQPLYKLAREGITVERKVRKAMVYSLKILDWKPPVITVEVECGKGTYIRSLAHDLGKKLGCGASLCGLIRTRCGPFEINDALTIPQLEKGNWQECLYPADFALSGMRAIVVNEENAVAIGHGKHLALQCCTGDTGSAYNYCRAYSEGGSFLAVLRFEEETGLWHPERVFPEESGPALTREEA